jgi:hypothetical protein
VRCGGRCGAGGVAWRGGGVASLHPAARARESPGTKSQISNNAVPTLGLGSSPGPRSGSSFRRARKISAEASIHDHLLRLYRSLTNHSIFDARIWNWMEHRLSRLDFTRPLSYLPLKEFPGAVVQGWLSACPQRAEFPQALELRVRRLHPCRHGALHWSCWHQKQGALALAARELGLHAVLAAWSARRHCRPDCPWVRPMLPHAA